MSQNVLPSRPSCSYRSTGRPGATVWAAGLWLRQVLGAARLLRLQATETGYQHKRMCLLEGDQKLDGTLRNKQNLAAPRAGE